jgi:thiamine-phosphate pyrophosphorylase
VALAGFTAAFRAAAMRVSMSARFSEMLMAANLYNHQRRLNADMPLVLMTDDRDADWADAAARLPRGGIVVVRSRDAKRRAALAEMLHGIAPLLIADDPALALATGAAGLHLPQARMREAHHWRLRRPDWILTSSAHSLSTLMHAHMLDAVFLSPVFATASHPTRRTLNPARAAFIAAAAPVPVYALGGITARNAPLLAPAFSGIAAIGSLL